MGPDAASPTSTTIKMRVYACMSRQKTMGKNVRKFPIHLSGSERCVPLKELGFARLVGFIMMLEGP